MNRTVFEIIRQKRSALLLVLVLLVLNVGLMFLIASHQEPALNASRSRWSELRSLAARTGRADAADLYKQGTLDLEKLKGRIPPKREFARVLGDLLESASDSGLATGSISYKPVSIKDEALLSYQLLMTVTGDYAAVKSYLSDLRQNQELLVLDSVTLNNSDLFAENVVMTLNITIYLREGA